MQHKTVIFQSPTAPLRFGHILISRSHTKLDFGHEELFLRLNSLMSFILRFYYQLTLCALKELTFDLRAEKMPIKIDRAIPT